jgi:VanZ family protein
MPALPTPYPLRRAADQTALRLGRALLGYLALMVGIITLAPFDFQSTPAHGWTTIWNRSDVVMNVLMFVPFGFAFQLTRPRGAPVDWPRVLLLGAALSGCIELAQLFAPQRYSSPYDLATNTLGAVLGAGVFAQLARRLPGTEAVRSFALELPLMGLAYQLIPLVWLVGLGADSDERRWLLLLPSAMAGAILGAVQAAYVAPQLTLGNTATAAPSSWRWLLVTLIGWAAMALPVAVRRDWALGLACITVLTGVALLRSLATTRLREMTPDGGAARRFELPTLRLLLPVFAGYLTLSALWPVTDLSTAWQGSWTLVLPGATLNETLVYRALEQVAAFTLVGYMSAEFHGRDTLSLSRSWPRVLAWALPVALLLQAGRGFRAGEGGSLSLLLLTQAAAIFGAWLYVLQRDHVRALVVRHASPRGSTT